MKNEYKIFIAVIMFMVLSTTAMACKESYRPWEDVIIEDVIEKRAEGAQCNITIYQNNTHVLNGTMVRTGLAYLYNASNLSIGTYVSGIQCVQGSTEAVGGCNFVVEGGRSDMQLAIVVLMIGIAVFFAWLATKQAQESPFRILYFMISLFMIPASIGVTRAMAVEWGIGASVISVLETVFNASLSIVVLVVTLVGVWMLVRWLRALKDKKARKERGEYDGLA